jgi:TPR repeat protein
MIRAASALFAIALAAPFATIAADALVEAEEALRDGRCAVAIERYRAAALAGDPRAQQALGYLLVYGDRLCKGASAEPVEGMRWLATAGAQGEAAAAYSARAWAARGVAAAPPAR